MSFRVLRGVGIVIFRPPPPKKNLSHVLFSPEIRSVLEGDSTWCFYSPFLSVSSRSANWPWSKMQQTWLSAMFSSFKKKKKSSVTSPQTSILEQEQQEDQQQLQRSRTIEFYTSPRYIQRSKDVFIVSKIRWGEKGGGRKIRESRLTVRAGCPGPGWKGRDKEEKAPRKITGRWSTGESSRNSQWGNNRLYIAKNVNSSTDTCSGHSFPRQRRGRVGDRLRSRHRDPLRRRRR